MMKISILFVVLLAFALLVEEGQCWGRRRRRRSGGRWSLSRGGVTYTFRNGATVTGHGGFNSIGVRVSIPFGRKRRSVMDGTELDAKRATAEQKATIPPVMEVDNEKKAKLEEKQPKIDNNDKTLSAVRQSQNRKDNCDECIEVQPFNINDQAIENKTVENNDFVMVVKYIEENTSALKLQAKIKFEVFDVVKSPVDSVKEGETFTIKAEMAKCPCLSILDPGYYVVTGSVNAEGQLVLSNVLMEFER
ncbi:uncharacterized protein LOC135696000 [Rhopilema esculentum]|uniref:uncharacterized protein LOC135696000 n=1 Tax=Rhopilema esculentum TaxID=499914 RepID=UPI0031E3998A|eukprot:gene12341-2992_t